MKEVNTIRGAHTTTTRNNKSKKALENNNDENINSQTI